MSGFKLSTASEIYAEHGIYAKDAVVIANHLRLNARDKKYTHSDVQQIVTFYKQAKEAELTTAQAISIAATQQQPSDTHPNPPGGTNQEYSDIPEGFDPNCLSNSLQAQATYALMETVQEAANNAFDQMQPYIPDLFRQVFRQRIGGVMGANFTSAKAVPEGTIDPQLVLLQVLQGAGIQPQFQLKSADPE